MDKKTKLMIAGFALFGTAASALSISLLFGKDQEAGGFNGLDALEVALGEVEQSSDGNPGSVEEETYIPNADIDPFVTDKPDFTPVVKEGEKEPEILPEGEADLIIRSVKPLIEAGNWQAAEELMRPALLEYDLREGAGNQRLSDLYADVTTMQSLMARGDTERMAALLGDLNDPAMFILAPLFFPQEVWYDIHGDSAGLMLSQRGNVTYNGRTEIPMYIDEAWTLNPDVEADPFIRAYRQRQTYAEPVEAYYIHDLTVRGIPIHGYSVRISGNDNRLIGYYHQPNSEKGSFQTISHFLEHRRNITEAWEDNWESE